MSDRYNVSKLLEVFTVRHIARNHPVSQLHVTVNTLTPGLCESELIKNCKYCRKNRSKCKKR